MVPENKQNRRYKQINFIGLQNNRHPSQHTGSMVSGLRSVSPLEEHHERHTFCRRGAIQKRVTTVLFIEILETKLLIL
jgi:hypothetical protein